MNGIECILCILFLIVAFNIFNPLEITDYQNHLGECKSNCIKFNNTCIELTNNSYFNLNYNYEYMIDKTNEKYCKNILEKNCYEECK